VADDDDSEDTGAFRTGICKQHWFHS